MSSAPELDRANELMAAIQRLGRLIGSRQVYSRIAGAAGADVSQQGVQILRALLRRDELPIAGLAEAAQMDIAAVSRQLRLLEASDLVDRSSSPKDARVTLVSLTPDGRRLAERIMAVGMRHLMTALASWSETDRRSLGRLLGRLVDDLVATDIVPITASKTAC